MRYFFSFVIALCAICFAQEKAATLLWDIPLNEGDFTQIRNLGQQSKTIPVAPKADKMEWGEGRIEGKALYFKNDPKGSRPVSHFYIPAEQSYDFSKPFTVSFWFFVDPACDGSHQYTMVGNVQSDYGPGFRILYGWGTLRAAFGGGTSQTNDGIAMHSSQVECPRNCWHNATLTYDGKQVRLYFNGLVVVEKELTIHPTKPAVRPFFIGSYNSSAYGFVGAISNIKLFDQALTPEEVLKVVKEL